MEDVQRIKQRFGIIGNTRTLNRAIDIAMQVAPTDLSVLITGESGVGKESFPQIIHQNSARKHGQYIAVNCGAIPEGTIDSELFGHEKGSFTGALEHRKGYFEVANGGTIFLDEVAELPMATQVRLLRVLETGEFIKVGSSKVLKTNVRVIAATNVNIPESIALGKFREDLYYRLNTVPIFVPPLRDRTDDLYLLFKKFALDFAEKYRMPAIRLDADAQRVLASYYWPGNVRQLKNITEQISVIEHQRNIPADTLRQYLPDYAPQLPALYQRKGEDKSFASEREILYKILFDMRNDVNELKKLMANTRKNEDASEETKIYGKPYNKVDMITQNPAHTPYEVSGTSKKGVEIEDTEEIHDESLSLSDKEAEMIKKALEKYDGRRRNAAQELGISERTLYRKIKEYNLE
ncbi:MAG: sigma-54 dependent transcriptional regulator [Bacteroidales bacterium]|jgi:transcriptional regulator with PAS, ATPase and Fis domain|nr:sigma-54 dependent transcriptional regulator [Bacteroidales bacterium]